MSGRTPSGIDPWLAGLFALEFLVIAGVTALLILMRSATEIVAFYGMLMLGAAALPVWLLASMRESIKDDPPAGRHTSA